MIALVSHKTLDIPAPADAVWNLIADFGSLADWWPPGLLEKVRVEGKGIGMVRALHTAIGIVLRERLDALIPEERRLEISITGDLPVGISDYRATGKVTAKGSDACTIEWTGHYAVPNRAAEESARAFIEGAYALMFKGIRGHVLKTST